MSNRQHNQLVKIKLDTSRFVDEDTQTQRGQEIYLRSFW